MTAADEISALERVHASSFVIPMLRGDLAATSGDAGTARELYLAALAILQERRDQLFFDRARPDPETAIQEVQDRLQRLSQKPE